MSHTEVAARDIARRLLALTANNQKSSSNCPEFAIDGIQTPKSRSIEEAKFRLEEAERLKREAFPDRVSVDDTSKLGVNEMTNEGTKLVELMKPGGYNFPKMFVTEEAEQIFGCNENDREVSDYESLLEKVSHQAKQIEMLEKLQTSDAEKLRKLQVENAQYRDYVENLFEEREIQLSQAYSEQVTLEKEKKALQSEVSELRGRCSTMAKDNLERQGSLFARVRELEVELQETRKELNIKTLHLDALSIEHSEVNRLLQNSGQPVVGD